MKKIIAELEQRNIMLVQNKILQEEEQNYEKRRKDNQSDNI